MKAMQLLENDTPVPRSASGTIKIVALATGFVMASLDITVVNVAGATVQARLHTTLTQLTWVVDGYVLTFASLLLLGGGLADRLGAKTAYMRGMGVFFVASLACALAPDGGVLIGARLVQGAGAALFMPSSLSLLVYSFPDRRERTRMLGLWSAIVAAAAGFGPTIGGIVVNSLGWRSVFLLNLPLGLVGMAMTRRYIAPVPGRPTRPPVLGHLILITTLAALSFALIEGPQLGWTAVPVLAAVGLGTAATLVLALRERRARTPIMPWPLFRDSSFTGANAVGFLFNFALFGNLFMLGLFFQHARGASPFQAGLELLPVTFSFPLANLVFSRISARYANGTLLTVCLLVAGAASIAMTVVSPGTPYWVMALVIGTANIGAGVIAPAMTATLVDSAGRDHANVAGSVLNANRQIGSLVGVAAVGALLHAEPDWYEGASATFLLVGTAYLIGSLCAWRLISSPEALTLEPEQPTPLPQEV
jgi:DHA2 family methylenomycin A resistance protein-like MFS transporter